ncbi:hypothetical protein [Streptomyces acidiscabies]|uniref:Uncharacterized protein n=1 Tax=Streptomyces acidiscabies TaxID=42234 RepID=A0A0L0K973_9ACTN|nr:hypothetical protein [Streptomyces acidiscabies]KND34214.1 hypothetical protein IQ63_16715 [Streptomyces acidiscabies]
MLLLSTLTESFSLALGLLAQARLGPFGVFLLFLLGVGLRARHSGLAVASATLLTVLMIQA